MISESWHYTRDMAYNALKPQRFLRTKEFFSFFYLSFYALYYTAKVKNRKKMFTKTSIVFSDIHALDRICNSRSNNFNNRNARPTCSTHYRQASHVFNIQMTATYYLRETREWQRAIKSVYNNCSSTEVAKHFFC